MSFMGVAGFITAHREEVVDRSLCLEITWEMSAWNTYLSLIPAREASQNGLLDLSAKCNNVRVIVSVAWRCSSAFWQLPPKGA